MAHCILVTGIWYEPNHYCSRTMGAYALKHWASQFGFTSQVIDFAPWLGSDLTKIVTERVTKETLVVGFSISFWPTNGLVPTNIQELVEVLRAAYPWVKIVIGGARKPKRDLGITFDQVFSGASEDSFVRYLQDLSGNSVRHLFNKKFDITKLAHRFDVNDAILDDEVLPIELGRGCVFKCKFCAHENLGKAKGTYQREHRLLLEELSYNKEKFNVSRYNFVDDTINEDQDKVSRLGRLPQDLGFSMQWQGYMRADLIWSNPNAVQQLKESGVQSTFFGIETLNRTAALAVGKGWSAKHAKKFLPQVHKDLGIPISANFIVGLPGEDRESLKDTLAWCLDNPIGSYQFVALTLYTEYEGVQSEFTRSYKDYGYTVGEPGTWHWNNGIMSNLDAVEICRDFNAQLLPRNQITSWRLFNARNLGDPTGVAGSDYFDYIGAHAPGFISRYKERLAQVGV